MLDNLLSEQYQKQNYKVVYNDNANRRCCIFCSSNGLWMHSEESFTNNIILHDKYEWENISKHECIKEYYGKVVFLRDIYMHFYVNGISSKINSIDAVLQMLQEETKDYETTVVGNSSGGYLAIIIGLALKSKRVYSFAGQVNLLTWGGGNDRLQFSDFPYLERNLSDPSKAKYFDLTDIVKAGGTDIFHFYAGRNRADIKQAKMLEQMPNCHLFKIREKTHGATVHGFSLPYALTMDNRELNCIQRIYDGKEITKIAFAFRVMGIIRTLATMLLRVFARCHYLLKIRT